uniref:PTS ascorbate transporter subunit IIC n=1 Tax=Anaerostipes caccae TaxID=105841 RepID=UPI003AB2CE2C
MAVINFIVNDIFRQPPLFLGLIALAGLLLQRASFSDIMKGTVKTILGVIVLMKAVDIISASMAPLAAAFTKMFAIQGDLGKSAPGMNEFIVQYGSLIGLVMVLAFILNCLTARFTRFKSIFLTGHIFFWIAFISVAVGVEAQLKGTVLIVMATLATTVYIVATPWLIRPFVKQVTGDDTFTIGHSCVGLSILAAYIGKLFGNKEKSTEDIKVPESLDFLRETTITTGIVMFLIYTVVGIIIGPAGSEAAFGAGNDAAASGIVFGLMQGLTFGAGLTVLLTGVRLMLGELIPAFRGIAQKLVPDAIPALDCPMIFPFAPNATLIGFVVSMIASIAAIVLMGASGIFSVAVIPLTVACFFDVGPAIVFANATGGRRGAVLASIVCGFLLIILEAGSIMILAHTVPDFVQAFGGNDFSILALLLRGITKIFGL